VWRVTMLLKGANGLRASQMFEGLLNDHAPYLLDNKSLADRHLKKINLAAGCNAPGSGLPNAFDASAEFWFDDEHAAGLGLALLTQDKELMASEARYVATERTVAWMGEYLPKLQMDGVRLKLTVTGDVADGCSIPEALLYWSDVHPEVARTAREFWAYLRLYSQIHGRRVLGLPQYRPMAADVGFESAEDFVTAYSHEQYRSIVRPDEMKFSKPEDMFAFATMDQRTILERK
jgi:hypothetical protein